MKNKIIIFGKPGGGKSTLSRKLSLEMNIELFALDLIEYKKNGERVSAEEYTQKHNELLNKSKWIIDGLGTLESFWQRVDASDILIYIDLPYYVSYWLVTKRLLKSLFIKPEGWPEGSSVLKGTIAGWKYLRLSRKFWTSELFEKVKSRADGKDVYQITSLNELNSFTKQISGHNNR